MNPSRILCKHWWILRGREGRGLTGLVLLWMMVLPLGGCAIVQQGSAPSASRLIADSDEYLIVHVGRGDGARELAARFLGDARRVWLIEEANPGIVPRPGEIVAIPLHETGRSGIGPGRAQSIPVLCYHRFGDRNQGMMISAERFDEQMRWLHDNGYHVIPLADMVGFLKGEKRLPRKSVVLTIDDGHQSIYHIAWPILRRYGYPATIFMYSDYLGRGGLTWGQIHEMSATGLIDVQAHSKTHANLNQRLEGESQAAWLKRIKQEVRMPAAKLRAGASAPVIAYAYPYGETNQQVIGLLKKYDYLLGFTVSPGGNASFSYPYALRRSMVFGERGLDAFRKALKTEASF